jgi:hypothetical protein
LRRPAHKKVATKKSQKQLLWCRINDCCTTETAALDSRDIVDWQLASCQQILVDAQGRQRFHVRRRSPVFRVEGLGLVRFDVRVRVSGFRFRV